MRDMFEDGEHQSLFVWEKENTCAKVLDTIFKVHAKQMIDLGYRG